MSTLATNAITDAAGGNTATINGQTPAESNMAGRNRIINGDMRIDQRKAGASYTITGDGEYGSVDRFSGRTYGGPGRFSMQQVTDAPADFLKSLKVTVTTTDTSGTYGYSVEQRIEGLNITDFNFGTASAATYTMSFWVKASIAGTYTCGNRTSEALSSCVNTYTINSANTWEKKTIVFPANTNFTTATDNDIGLYCDFGFGAQTSKATSTLNEWQAGNYVFNSGQVDLIATSGATFQVTGVQLEVGSVATPFEHVDYSEMLRRCQRYYEKSYNADVVPGSASTRGYSSFNNPEQGAAVYIFNTDRFRVEKRAAATMVLWDLAGTTGRTTRYTLGGLSRTDGINNIYSYTGGQTGAVIIVIQAASTAATYHWTASAEL